MKRNAFIPNHIVYSARTDSELLMGTCWGDSWLWSLRLAACRDILEPPPVDLLVDELVLNDAADVEPVRLGLYNAFRGMGSPTVIAGSFTADFIQHNGTFTVYNELGNKQITATNPAAEALWGSVYNTIYIANFIEEAHRHRTGRNRSSSEANSGRSPFPARVCQFHWVPIRFGDIPNVTTTDIDTNRNIPKATQGRHPAVGTGRLHRCPAGPARYQYQQNHSQDLCHPECRAGRPGPVLPLPAGLGKRRKNGHGNYQHQAAIPTR